MKNEFWILTTPGGEFIDYDEPMNMDWTLCSKRKVIDATGMPSKEEMDKGLQDILEDLVYVAASRIDKPRPSPETDKIIEWLLKLAAE
jgi:hypothetical protein